MLAEHPGLVGPFQLQLIRAAPWHGAPLAEGARELRGQVHARGAGGQDAGRRGGARERATHDVMCVADLLFVGLFPPRTALFFSSAPSSTAVAAAAHRNSE